MWLCPWRRSARGRRATKPTLPRGGTTRTGRHVRRGGGGGEGLRGRRLGGGGGGGGEIMDTKLLCPNCYAFKLIYKHVLEFRFDCFVLNIYILCFWLDCLACLDKGFYKTLIVKKDNTINASQPKWASLLKFKDPPPLPPLRWNMN